MSLACLERLTAAHPENCLSLVTSSVEFSRGKRTRFPAVPLACILLVRNKQLIANRATQICVEICLQLLMNLTHSGTGSGVVAEHKGIESLTEIVWHLSTGGLKNGEEHGTACRVPDCGADGEHPLHPVFTHVFLRCFVRGMRKLGACRHKHSCVQISSQRHRTFLRKFPSC
jgi:hypothetical protein